MKHIATIILAALLSLSALASSPKREFRGAWLHIVGNTSFAGMSSSEVQDYLCATLDSLVIAGCNAVFFQVRPEADACYPSPLEPWTRYLTGVQGKAPEPFWDPLQFMIEQCHSRRLELHAWLNPYRVTVKAGEQLSEGHIYYEKPELFVKYGDQLYFNPGEPGSREHILAVIKDIVSRYDVDGIHFDDYFYPYPIKGKDFNDAETFRKYAAAQGFSKEQKGDWRRNNVTTLIAEVNAAVKEIKPWVRFGVSPFGIHRNISEGPDGSLTNGLSGYSELFADTPLWAREGYVDYLAPQLYWKIGHKAADYETLANWWNEQELPGQLYLGQSIETFSEKDLQNPSTTQMRRKMELSRELPGIQGNIWWPGWSIAENICNIKDSLSTIYQKHPAFLPAYVDIDGVAPERVEAWLSHVSGQVRWITGPVDDPMQEAMYFAVYRFEADEEPDISKIEKLYMLTVDTSFMPEPADVEAGRRFVITVLDRCWNESEPSEPVQPRGY